MKQIITFLFCLIALTLFGQNTRFKIDSILQKAYDDKALNGTILIAKEGKIVFEKSYGFANFEKKIPLSKNTQFQIASVSKQFTAFGIMVLKRQGKLNYDDKVAQFIPNFPYPDISLRHLMQHTAGLPNFWTDIRLNLDTTRSNGNKEVIDYLIKNKLPLRSEIGEKWEYADIGYDILATIIERVSGQSYQKFLEKQVFRPAGMQNTEGVMVTDIRRIKAKNLARGYIQDSIKGNELAHEIRNFVFYLGDFYGDGSVISTARDLKKWDDALRLYMQQDSLHFGEAYRPIIRKDGSVLELQKGVSYGFGWGLRDELPMGKTYSHSGGHPGFITNYYRYPDKKTVLIVCRNVEQKVSFGPYLQAIRALLPSLILEQDDTATRIKRIENNLLPSIIINGTNYEKSTIEEEMKKEKVAGLSIAFVDNGQISWTKCYGLANVANKTPVTPTTLFAAASISKPLTAVCVLTLVQNGKLDLDIDVNTYLTSWKVPENALTKTEKVTLRRLLGHTAGIDNRVFKFYAATDKLPTTTELLRGGYPSKDTAVTLTAAPGSAPNYSNAGYVILQQILEDVLKKPFDKIVDNLVLRPAKMTLSTIKQPLSKQFQDKSATGYFADGKKVTNLTMPFMSAAGLFTTPSELGKLMIELEKAYTGLSAKILNKDMAQQLFERDNNSLGFFKSVNNADILFYHKGHTDGFASQFNGILDKKQGVIIMTNGDTGDGLVEKIVRAVANEYQWDYLTTKAYNLYKNDAEILNDLCGKYEMPQDKMTISQKEGKVYFQSEYGGNTLEELYPIGKNQFINPKIPLIITFTGAYNKPISGLQIEAFGQIYSAKKK
jgi:CubicO group peptidase (beta-lactamase class C family)